MAACGYAPSRQPLDGLERFRVGVHDHVGEARHFRVELRAAQVLWIDLLANGERGEEGARHGEHRALAHHAEVREHRVPR